MEHTSTEMQQLIIQVTDAQFKDNESLEKWKVQVGEQYKTLSEPMKKYTRVVRKQIRYRIFRIREGKSEYDLGLKKWFELQFAVGMTWDNFSFTWDVSSKDPLKIIDAIEWDGQVILDKQTGKRFCDPPAFTNQGI
jgi:hypothetical protein